MCLCSNRISPNFFFFVQLKRFFILAELILRPPQLNDQSNLPNEFKINRNITFDSMNRMPNSMKSASVSYKKLRKLM